MKYLLDTCVISELTKPIPNNNVIRWLKNIQSDSLFISVITIGEIRKGLTKLKESEKKQRLTEWLDALLRQYSERILPVDLDIAQNWGIIQGNTEKTGKPMSSVDSMLAATAYTHNLTVVTRNEKDFEAGNVLMINPWKMT